MEGVDKGRTAIRSIWTALQSRRFEDGYLRQVAQLAFQPSEPCCGSGCSCCCREGCDVENAAVLVAGAEALIRLQKGDDAMRS
jgi:hypothetical protein